MINKTGVTPLLGIPGDDPKLQILDFFRQRADAGEPPPTLREIAGQCGWSSSAAARYHVNKLVKAGLLAHSPGKSRAAHLAETVSLKLPFVLDLGSPAGERDRFLDIAVPKQLLPPAARPFIVQATEASPACDVVGSDLLIVRDDREPVRGDQVVLYAQRRVWVTKFRQGLKARCVGILTGVMRYRPQAEDGA
jgi:SOS-response transcriptional repressor LexA